MLSKQQGKIETWPCHLAKIPKYFQLQANDTLTRLNMKSLYSGISKDKALHNIPNNKYISVTQTRLFENSGKISLEKVSDFEKKGFTPQTENTNRVQLQLFQYN